MRPAIDGTGVQNLDYEWSVIGNLTRRTDHNQTVNGQIVSETFEYDHLNRVHHATVAGQARKSFDYDPLGNILAKDTSGAYSYTAAQPETLAARERAKPHAVRSVNGQGAARYDANGNMTSGFGRTLTWTSFNMPIRIERGNASSHFTYSSEHTRITQRSQKDGLPITTVYVGGGLYEYIDNAGHIDRKAYISREE
jgi:hypothetical protein